jgi:hypothetical protein
VVFSFPPGTFYEEVRLDQLAKMNLALGRAKRRGDNGTVIAVANQALAYLRRTGKYPDDWSKWDREKMDAIFRGRR